MGVRDALAALIGGGQQMQIQFMGNTIRDLVLGLTPEELYRSQPHLRTVLSFVARNAAHLGLKSYERTSDTDRRRLHDDPLPLLLQRPNPEMTGFELVESLVSDLGLYDVAYWLLAEVSGSPSGWELRPIPPSWVVQTKSATAFSVESYTLQMPNGKRTDVPADSMVVFHGWNPGKPKDGTSPIHALKLILEEQMQAWAYRTQVWKRGGRIGAYLSRPAGSSWSPEARDRFMAAWKSKFTGDGEDAGGTPILEDGMTLGKLRFNAREEEWAEATKIALSTVAAVFHVNPVMVGILDNANFSNTKEFRKMLYSETLGPTLARLEDRINTFLVPRVSKTPGAYVEFNIQEKLQGDFEEQAAVISTAVGRPWMTADEARSKFNMPALGGEAAQLVVPLNVLIGGQASPRDSAPKAAPRIEAKSAARLKSADVNTDPYVVAARQVLDRFFKRQAASVLSELGSKDPAWWDGARWDSELATDLFKLAATTATEIGKSQAESLGFRADDYDEARTLAFLKAVAATRAGAINATTRDRIQAALDAGTDPADVFDEAKSARTDSGSNAFVAAIAGFAVAEVGKQLAGDRATKTWNTGGNPRASHAAMNGETVGIDDLFSNGMKWPGDVSGGADEVAGCNCGLTINF